MLLGRKSYNKVVIVEPHSDDAFISIGNILIRQNPQNVHLLTMGAGEVNGAMESANLPQIFKGITHEYLGYLDARLKKSEILKTKEALKDHLTIEGYFKFYNPEISFKHVVDKLCSYGADAYLFPIGLHHPMHEITYWLGKLLQELYGVPVYYYLDVPYCHQKRVQDYTTSQYKLIPIGSVLEKRIRNLIPYVQDVTDMEGKRRIFGQIYKTQWFIGVQLKDFPTEVIYGPE